MGTSLHQGWSNESGIVAYGKTRPRPCHVVGSLSLDRLRRRHIRPRTFRPQWSDQGHGFSVLLHSGKARVARPRRPAVRHASSSGAGQEAGIASISYLVRSALRPTDFVIIRAFFPVAVWLGACRMAFRKRPDFRVLLLRHMEEMS